MQNFKITSLNNSRLSSLATSEFEENHKHEYFEIIWIQNGDGIHKIDLYNHPYKGSAMFILSPGQINKIKQNIPTDGYIVKFLPSIFRYEKEFFDYVLDTCLFDSDTVCPVINVPTKLELVLKDMFVRIDEEFVEADIDTENIVSSYLKILITQINRLKRKKTVNQVAINEPQYGLFREFKIAVEKHYKKEHSVKKYAELLRTQTRTLNTVSNKYGNKTASKIIKDRVLLEARRYLIHETLSIKEIGYDLGFEDPAYFTRFFKKNTGIAPKYFKEKASFSI